MALLLRQGRAPLISAVALATALAGCAVGPDYQAPDAPKTQRYAQQRWQALQSGPQQLNPDADVALRWWQGFGSQPLNQLIETALHDSPDLTAAEQRLRQAQAQLAAQRGGNWLSVDADVNARRQRQSSAAYGGAGGNAAIFNLVTAQVQVSYSPDVFGGRRRAIEASAAEAQAAREKARAAYLTLVGNVVTQAIAEAGLRARVQATQDIIELQKQALNIAGHRVQAGAADYASLLDARSRLAATRASLPGLRKRLAQTRDTLRSLAGHLPTDRLAGPIRLDALNLPHELPVSLPSQLVKQRPDIRAAEARLHAASAQVGIATARLYPHFTLTGSWGATGRSGGEVFGGNGDSIWSVGLDLLAPLLHGGTLHAQKRAAVAAYKASLADYNRVALDAFADVAGVLHGLSADNQSMADRRAALKAADEAQHIVTEQYRAGGASYLAVINAQTQYLQTRIDFINARVQRLQDTAALYVALGGGWWQAPDRAPWPLRIKETHND